MIKRAVILPAARGYVDGRFVGDEKDTPDGRGRKGRGKGARGSAQPESILGDNAGNTTRKKRGSPKGKPRTGQSAAGTALPGARKKRGPRGDPRGSQTDTRGAAQGNVPEFGNTRGAGNNRGTPRPATRQRKGSTGKSSPFRSAPPAAMTPSEGVDLRRVGEEAKSGQFAEALAASANVKRERLHKILAQSGHGSRRDMEIMIASGRVMVNGIVATAGTQVAHGDRVLVDLRPVKLKFTEDLPRVLLYHKPEGEIVTTSDPGNRITVFDNLPRVETGKWVAVGRLDINTSGLLIFTTSGELANRFMHPRYEVEREYAVRILGELTEEQTQQLLTGIKIDDESDQADKAVRADSDDRFNRVDADEHDDIVDTELLDYDETDAEQANDLSPFTAPAKPAFVRDPLARFDVIEKRGGEGVNQWYHVVIREGRNREVRKMFEALGLTVSRLIRTRFGKVELPPRLLRGKMVELTADQVRTVLVSAGMEVDGATAPLNPRNDKMVRKPGGHPTSRGRRTGPADGNVERERPAERAPRERGGDDTRRRRGKPGPGRVDGAQRPPAFIPHDDSGVAPIIGDGLMGEGGQRPPREPREPREPGSGANKSRRARRGRTRTGAGPREGTNTVEAANVAQGGDVAGGGNADNNVGNRGAPTPTGDRGANDRGGRSRRTFRSRRRTGPPKSGGDGGGNGNSGGNRGGDDFGNR